MTIGERIKRRREELGISVDELASVLGVNRATIYRYESNEIAKFPVDILESVAKALKTTPVCLMSWDSKDTDTPAESLEALELAKKIGQMSPDNRRLVIDLINKLGTK